MTIITAVRCADRPVVGDHDVHWRAHWIRSTPGSRNGAPRCRSSAAAILAICMVLVGIKLGAKSVASQRGQHRPSGGDRVDRRPGDRRCPDRRRVDHRPDLHRCRVEQRNDAAGAGARGHRRRITPPRDPIQTSQSHITGGEALTGNDDQVIYSDDYTRLFTYQSRQFTAGDLSLKAINGVQWNAALPAAVISGSGHRGRPLPVSGLSGSRRGGRCWCSRCRRWSSMCGWPRTAPGV